MATKAQKDAKKNAKKLEKGKARKAVTQVASAVTSMPPMVSWMIILGIALPAVVAFVITIKRYSSTIKQKNALQKPLEKFRNDIAEVLEIDIIKHDSEMAVEELLKLESHIEKALNDLEEEKTSYSKLFIAGKSSHGWQLFGRSLYYTAKGAKSWYDAEYFCMSRGAHLASILSDEEQNFITSQLQRPAWIGLTDKNEKNAWEWTDGSRLVKQYWSEGESSVSEHHGETEYCTSLVPSVNGHNWNHANCYKQNGWMCKETLPVDEL